MRLRHDSWGSEFRRRFQIDQTHIFHRCHTTVDGSDPHPSGHFPATVSQTRLRTNFATTSELNFGIFFADGHTEKQMLPIIQYKGKTIVFMADLLPTVGHIPLPYVMGYDTRPLLTLDEKKLFLNMAADEEYLLFLEHDAYNELCTVRHTEKGVRLKNTYKFNEIFN